MKYKWEFTQYNKENLDEIVEKLQIPKFIGELLCMRGIDTVEKAEIFFHGTKENFRDPEELKGIKEAVLRIEKAIKDGEEIVIYGDYDVDGITSIVVLKNVLEKLGGKVRYALPNRFQDGYGVKVEKVEKVYQEKPFSLLITVDCGVKAKEEIKQIHGMGIDVIITDHHEPDEELPDDVIAIINPKIEGSGFENEPLAGVGVVYKFVQALQKHFNVELDEEFIIKLVSIGTVADLVPLIGENRIIVKEGLKTIRETETKELEAIFNSCHIDRKNLACIDISYKIAPRINALGRLGDASFAIELFSPENSGNIKEYVDYMNRKNYERQKLEKTLEKLIHADLDEERLMKQRFLLLRGENWHRGVIGIVASKIQKKYYRPVGIVSIEDGIGYGSIRSIEGINIIEVLDTCRDLLENYGGHHQAAGITLKAENIPILHERVNQYLFENYPEDLFVPRVTIDFEIELSQINEEFYEYLRMLEPFGIGNPQPIFLTKDVIVESDVDILSDKHIRFYVSDGLHKFVVIGYNKVNQAKYIEKFCSIDIVYTLDKVRWNNREYFQLNLIDFKVR